MLSQNQKLRGQSEHKVPIRPHCWASIVVLLVLLIIIYHYYMHNNNNNKFGKLNEEMFQRRTMGIENNGDLGHNVNQCLLVGELVAARLGHLVVQTNDV